MKARALRDLSAVELQKKLDEVERELFALRIKISQQRNTGRIRELRRERARLKTVLHELGARA
ncbi:MAG: 50S ribosomal protein L29 [Armatimonadota bacterium]|nr:50S ribosomal protein L29 [Armatimonadota bacterium]MDR7534086.1 50S ribosomal protein L29 [Armatimonadota bacterium]MDR7537451.1 50S ribosomal protein L29 [Armatimonadota bacterium]